MVLIKPSTPYLPLNKTTTPISWGTMSIKPTEQKEEHDEDGDKGSEGDVSGEVIHYVSCGGACISTYPTIATILQIFIVIIL